MMVTVRPATAIRLARYFNSATRMESAGVNLAWLGINATGRDLVWLVVQFNKFVFLGVRTTISILRKLAANRAVALWRARRQTLLNATLSPGFVCVKTT